LIGGLNTSILQRWQLVLSSPSPSLLRPSTCKRLDTFWSTAAANIYSTRNSFGEDVSVNKLRDKLTMQYADFRGREGVFSTLNEDCDKYRRFTLGSSRRKVEVLQTCRLTSSRSHYLSGASYLEPRFTAFRRAIAVGPLPVGSLTIQARISCFPSALIHGAEQLASFSLFI
jgi:hypothetical protein